MRHRLSAAGFLSLTKVTSSPSSINHDALMFIARTRTCCLRAIPIARLHHTAAKMGTRDYAVCLQQYAYELG
jgi:hypothetical protein